MDKIRLTSCFCKNAHSLQKFVTSQVVFQDFFNSTPWKINMEPENDGLEDDFPFQLGDF